MKLVKSGNTLQHMFLFSDHHAIMLEGSFKGKVVDITDDTLVDHNVYRVSCGVKDNHLFVGMGTHLHGVTLDLNDICLTNIIERTRNGGNESGMFDWDVKHQVRNHQGEWTDIDIVATTEDVILFRFLLSVYPAAPAAAAPPPVNDVLDVNCKSINKSSDNYRTIKTAIVTLNSECTSIVNDGPVKAIITVELNHDDI